LKPEHKIQRSIKENFDRAVVVGYSDHHIAILLPTTTGAWYNLVTGYIWGSLDEFSNFTQWIVHPGEEVLCFNPSGHYIDSSVYRGFSGSGLAPFATESGLRSVIVPETTRATKGKELSKEVKQDAARKTRTSLWIQSSKIEDTQEQLRKQLVEFQKGLKALEEWDV